MLLGLCLHITLGWFLYFQAEAVRAEVPLTEAPAQEAEEEDDAEADWIYGRIKNKREKYGFISSPSPQLSAYNGDVFFIPTAMKTREDYDAIEVGAPVKFLLEWTDRGIQAKKVVRLGVTVKGAAGWSNCWDCACNFGMVVFVFSRRGCASGGAFDGGRGPGPGGGGGRRRGGRLDLRAHQN